MPVAGSLAEAVGWMSSRASAYPPGLHFVDRLGRPEDPADSQLFYLGTAVRTGF